VHRRTLLITSITSTITITITGDLSDAARRMAPLTGGHFSLRCNKLLTVNRKGKPTAAQKSWKKGRGMNWQFAQARRLPSLPNVAPEKAKSWLLSEQHPRRGEMFFCKFVFPVRLWLRFFLVGRL
jgi:hypothetical protein